MAGGEATGLDGADRRHDVRIEYGDFGETSEAVREITELHRYQAKMTVDFTANQESLEFTDLIVITDDGFISCGKY